MKLTLKCLIDFRSWLGENYHIHINCFKKLPEFVQNAYYMEFLGLYRKSNNALIELYNEYYNRDFQKELDENNE